MALIPISNDLQFSEDLAEYLLLVIEEDRAGYARTPTTNEVVRAKTRTGLSADLISDRVKARFNEIGLPSGPIDQHPNVMEEYTDVIIDEIVKAIQTEMKVILAVNPGIITKSTGANSAGNVASVGATDKYSGGIGQAV